MIDRTLDESLAEINRQSTGSGTSIKQLNYIFNFIKDNDIKAGATAVPIKYIYMLYCDQQRPVIRRRRFAYYFKKFFPHKAAAHRVYFRLDPSPFKMPAGYTIWKEQAADKFKFKKSKFHNIKHTPDGWMIYLDLPAGRKLFQALKSESKAARMADKLAYFYFGPDYNKFNFKKKEFFEDAVLLTLLQQGKLRENDPQEKETI